MLPFLGKGVRGAERGVKLALIGKFPLTQSVPLPTRRVVSSTCRQRRSNQSVYSTAGIKESLHDLEALASYLLYRLNVLDPVGMKGFPAQVLLLSHQLLTYWLELS